ncbi:MAG: exodeoxyribonuclease VII large subunit, partial [Microbacteriaceae bacterium]|nr:exodeoxyribonuclease VII large subunit [Microbacteriaceae bacterium]
FAKVKDLEQDATLGLTVWSRTLPDAASEFKPGDRVIVRAKVDFWANRGELTLNARELRHVGLGDLMERLERLRRQLADEGLFDPSRKVPLPFLPQCIGLVTGENSDAEKDVIRNARLRWPDVRFRTRYALVQGERAAAEVAAGIRELDADPEVDVIIVARGGGDFMNLLPFSDEALLRTAAACVTPLVSAIGHENDRPLLDEVADLRASTPTDAAKRVVPDVVEELAGVRQARTRLLSRVSAFIANEIERVAALRSRPALATTAWIVDRREEEVARWAERGTRLVERRVELAEASLAQLAGQLRALSPVRTLERGYAIAFREDGTILRSAAEVAPGDAVRVMLGDGEFRATAD